MKTLQWKRVTQCSEEIIMMLKHFQHEIKQNHLSALVKNVTTWGQDKCGKVHSSSLAVIDKILEYVCRVY